MVQLPDIFTSWLTHYGSVSLFFLLALGIFALPIPDETLMVFSGVLIFKGNLPLFPTLIASYGGAICGISISYTLGRTAGSYLIKRWGGLLKITEAKMQRAHAWFEKTGKWSLLIGYFIPGVRHLTGYAAGMSLLHYRYFALFAYSGAIIWVSTFIALGYFLGDRLDVVILFIQDQWYLGVIFLLVVLGIYLLNRLRKSSKR